ncbi:hypothetical protein [Nocardia acidivorans]|uniref:hypothetical protein n=1 Tax=Nocardia acidivorans TaxID=404580 RepID=UPI000B2330C1|nr:hypothetical protein [Nocardia acidivorans]
MTSDPSTTNPSRQAAFRGVRWFQPSHHREPAQALLRGHRPRRGAAAPGRDATVGIDITCPSCRHDDRVQRVPAIRATGTTTVYGTDYHSGVAVGSTGLIPVVGSSTTERTYTTSLSQSLALAPLQQHSGKLVSIGLILVIPALFGILFAVINSSDPELTSCLPVFIVANFLFITALATPSLFLFWIASHRTRRNSRIAKGISISKHIWSAGHYCHRCGYCFWPYPIAPGIPARQAITPENYRRIVWGSGGYANL